MKLFAKIHLNLSGNKSSYLINGTEKYFEKLRVVYKDLENGIENDYLFFAFFTLCSATLEYSLNYLLADYCVQKFGPDKYKQYFEEFINLRFKNKLLILPHLVTDGNYRMNEDSFAFKKLCELINNRNRLLHNKEFLKEFDLPLNFQPENNEIQIQNGNENIEFALEIEENIIEKLNREMCLDYARAMSDFKKHIMNCILENNIAENLLLIKNL